MENRLMRRFGSVVGFAAVLGLTTTPAFAVPTPVAVVDYAVAQASGAPLTPAGGPVTNPIITTIPVFENHGNLTTRVFQEASGKYLYEALVEPIVTNITVFGTSFSAGVWGFTGKAGVSFADVINASPWVGAPGPAAVFDLLKMDDGNLQWRVTPEAQAGNFWNGHQRMTFFYESSAVPGTASYIYSMTNQFPGSALGLAPVPEPATLLLLGSGLTSVGLWARWRKGRQ